MEFLGEMWNSIVETMEYQNKFDTDDNKLPDHEAVADTTYDTLKVEGDGIYSAVLTAQALEAVIQIGELLGEDAQLEKYREWLVKAKSSIGKKLWNKEKGYFNFSEHSDAIMADAMLGIHFAKLYGLNPVLADEQVRSHLRTVYDYNFLKFAEGKRGVVNVMGSDGKAIGEKRGDVQADEIWIGQQRTTAALMVSMGMLKEAFHILQVDNQNTWLGGYANRTPEAIDINGDWRAALYMRALSIYNVYLALINTEETAELDEVKRRNSIRGFITAISASIINTTSEIFTPTSERVNAIESSI